MKTFVVLRQQYGEGCDYSIGCGKDYGFFQAESIQDVWTRIVKYYDLDSEYVCESYRVGDFALKEFCIIEVAKMDRELFRNHLKKAAINIKEEKLRKEKAMELKELERLKKKYEGKT